MGSGSGSGQGLAQALAQGLAQGLGLGLALALAPLRLVLVQRVAPVVVLVFLLSTLLPLFLVLAFLSLVLAGCLWLQSLPSFLLVLPAPPLIPLAAPEPLDLEPMTPDVVPRAAWSALTVMLAAPTPAMCSQVVVGFALGFSVPVPGPDAACDFLGLGTLLACQLVDPLLDKQVGI